MRRIQRTFGVASPAAKTASLALAVAVLLTTALGQDRGPTSRSDRPTSPAARPDSSAPAAPAAAPTSQPQPTSMSAEELGARRLAGGLPHLRMVQSAWLTDMARALWPGKPNAASTPLWQLDRQIVLLEAAEKIDETYPTALQELSAVRGDAAAAYRAAAEESLRQAVSATPDRATQLRTSADQAARQSEDLRLASLESLSQYVRYQPQDLLAWNNLLLRRLELLQSANERVDYLQKELDRLDKAMDQARAREAGMAPTTAPAEPLLIAPYERRSTLLMLLGEYARRQGDNDKASKLLHEAVTVLPLNRQAKQDLLDLAEADGKATPADYLDLYLTDFRMSPASPDVIAALSTFLARYGLYSVTVQTSVGDKLYRVDRGAVNFLNMEAVVRSTYARNQPLPADLLMRMAETYLLAGAQDDAVNLCKKSIDQAESGSILAGGNDPKAPLPAIDLPARILLIEIFRDKKDTADADIVVKSLTDYYAAHRTKAALVTSGPSLGWLSWFYLRIQNDPRSAVELGRYAVKATPQDPVAVCSLGAALASGDEAQAKEAVGLLEPLVRSGVPWSAFYLAKAKRTLGQPAQADSVLRTLATAWPGTRAGVAARQALGAAAPPAPSTDAMRDLLAGLPQLLFEFFNSPGTKAVIGTGPFAGLEPWDPVVSYWVQLSNATPATNAGFPITVGQGLMVWPQIVVSASVQLPGEPSPRVFANYCRVRMPSPQFVLPGEKLLTLTTLDVGPVGQLLRMTPQAACDVKLSFTINPEYVNGQWQPGLAGYIADSTFTRKARLTDYDALKSLGEAVHSEQVTDRLVAHRALASLLVEQQLAARLAYKPHNVPLEWINGPLEIGATDADPTVRAFWCDAVYPVGLSGKLLHLAVNDLKDTNWLVRLLAVRLLGDRFGQAYVKDITSMAGSDPSPLVKRLAQSYLDQWGQQKK